MRVSREEAAKNRERIVASAAALFREKGFDGVGVDAIMKSAGLTHGGFYGHFASKDDLVVQAVTRAFQDSAAVQGQAATLDELVATYLSDPHCADRAHGCVFAALGPDLARQGHGLRQAATESVRRQLERITRLLKGGTAERRRKRAIATLAGMVGGLTLARSVGDPTLSKEILATMREALSKG